MTTVVKVPPSSAAFQQVSISAFQPSCSQVLADRLNAAARRRAEMLPTKEAAGRSVLTCYSFRVDELLDIVDESGRPTGEVVLKSEAHRLGLWHRCFHCWICGSDAAGSYVLLQRRAATKDTWPNYLDVPPQGTSRQGRRRWTGYGRSRRSSACGWSPIGSSRSGPAGWSRRYRAAATGSFMRSSSSSTLPLRGTCASRRRRSVPCFASTSPRCKSSTRQGRRPPASTPTAEP